MEHDHRYNNQIGSVATVRYWVLGLYQPKATWIYEMYLTQNKSSLEQRRLLTCDNSTVYNGNGCGSVAS